MQQTPASDTGQRDIQIPADFTGLFVATPSGRDELKGAYVRSLLRTQGLFMQLGLPLEYFLHVREGIIDRARDHMTAAFMASDCSHMLQIDDDISWHPQDVVRLLTHARVHDIVMGIYRRKRQEIDYPVCWLQRNGEQIVPNAQTGCLEIESGPGGFVLMTRRAIVEMQAAHPELRYITCRDFDAQRFALYSMMQDGTTRFGEDISFCRRWRALGGSIWADPYIRLAHWGDAEFAGNPVEHLLRPATPAPLAQSGAA